MEGKASIWRYNYLLFLALVAGLFVRALLVLYFANHAGLQPEQVVRGHDGGEYVDFARGLARGGIDSVPADARRHDPGWPVAIIPVVKSTSHGGLFAWAEAFTLLVCAAVLGKEWLRSSGLANETEVLRWVWAMVLFYPAQVYYGCFALSESAFTLTLVAALDSFVCARKAASEGRKSVRWWRLSAYMLAGVAGLIRSPGMLLGVGIFLADLYRFRTSRRRNWIASALHLWPVLLTFVPWMFWTHVAHRAWGGDLLVHGPQFSWPFSGFVGWREFGAARVVYVAMCVAAVIASTIALVLLYRRVAAGSADVGSYPEAGVRADVAFVCAAFCVLFVLFHLCLRSLHYIDRDVLTFNYQDRYYVGLLPFLLLPWLRWLRWWVLVGGALVSVGLSAYWGVHYFAAVGG